MRRRLARRPSAEPRQHGLEPRLLREPDPRVPGRRGALVAVLAGGRLGMRGLVVLGRLARPAGPPVRRGRPGSPREPDVAAVPRRRTARRLSMRRRPRTWAMRSLAGLATILDPRTYLHALRLLHYYNYTHVQPLR